MKIINVEGPYGDDTWGGYVEIDNEYGFVGDVVDEIIDYFNDKPKEFYRFYIKNKEYKNKKDIPSDVLKECVIYVTWNGGWGANNFYFKINDYGCKN